MAALGNGVGEEKSMSDDVIAGGQGHTAGEILKCALISGACALFGALIFAGGLFVHWWLAPTPSSTPAPCAAVPPPHHFRIELPPPKITAEIHQSERQIERVKVAPIIVNVKTAERETPCGVLQAPRVGSPALPPSQASRPGGTIDHVKAAYSAEGDLIPPPKGE